MASQPKKQKKGSLDEDQAVAAYAEFMSGDGSLQSDVEQIQKEKQKQQEHMMAQSELDNLANNDATAAFAGLVESQEVEEKAIVYEGSGEEPSEQKTPPKKTAPARKDAKKVVKKDVELINQEESNEEQVEISTGKKSKMQSVIDKLKAGKTVEEVRAEQQAGKKTVSTKKAAPKKKAPVKKASPKKKPEPEQEQEESAETEESASAQPAEASDAEVDTILNEIKAASANIKEIEQEDISADAGSLL